jgi:hypothetical protein
MLLVGGFITEPQSAQKNVGRFSFGEKETEKSVYKCAGC